VLVSSGSTRAPIGLLVIGAGLIVANWVVLGLLVGRWNPSTFYVVIALMVLLSAVGFGGVSIGVKAQRFIGWFFGLSALVIIVTNLRYDGFPHDATGWIATIIFYVGAVLMFVGAGHLSD